MTGPVRTFEVERLHVVHAAPATPVPGRPPLLLVHGAGHGAWCWKLWQERLPELGWESYALSVRNHPGSYDLPEETFLKHTSVDDYADDVATVAAHIGRPSVAVGHSMGGIVCQRYVSRALAGGQPVAGLVLLASVGPGEMSPVMREPVSTDAPRSLGREEAAARYFHSAQPDVLEWALDNITPESASVFNEFGAPPGVAIAADAITCPLLVVTGEYDKTACPRDDRIARYYGGEWLHAAEDGHDLMLEGGWAALLDRIVAWLEPRVGRG